MEKGNRGLALHGQLGHQILYVGRGDALFLRLFFGGPILAAGFHSFNSFVFSCLYFLALFRGLHHGFLFLIAGVNQEDKAQGSDDQSGKQRNQKDSKKAEQESGQSNKGKVVV